MNLPEQEGRPFQAGDVLFLERPVAGIPLPTGYYAVVRRTEGSLVVSLISQDADGLCASDRTCTVSIEDIPAFTLTGERVGVPS